MQSNPLISVVVPSYNYVNYLPHLFDSLIKQTYANWECIVVDDESKDHTKEFVLSYSKKEPRIKYVFQKNAGPAAARKLGVEKSSGDFIQFVDADDYIGFDKFKIEIDLFREYPHLDIVYSNYSFVDQDLKTFWIDSKKWLSLSEKPFIDFVKYWEAGLMIPIHCYLFKKECFLKFGSFDPAFKTHEDWDLNLNFSINGAVYLYHDYIGAYYRIHGSSSSRSNLTLNRKDTLRVIIKYIHHPKVVFEKKLLLISRYATFFTDFLIERIKYKKIEFLTVLKNKAAFWLNVYACVFFPLYLMLKIYKKYSGK